MKKIVLIIVAAVIVVSILVLGIFAPTMGQSSQKIKVESVNFNRDDEVEFLNGGEIDYHIELSEDEYTYQLVWYIYPYDMDEEKSLATNTKVTFSSSNQNVTVTSDGLVTFPSEMDSSISTVITIKTEDQGATSTINIFKYFNPERNH